MTNLTAPDAINAKQSDRYYVEIACQKRDWEGVPELTRTIDVLVPQPTPEAITTLTQRLRTTIAQRSQLVAG